MKIGFIGVGNLASAVIAGSIASGRFSGSDYLVYDLFAEKVAENVQRYSTSAASSAQQIAETCDVVVLAVKPKDFAALLASLTSALKANDPLLISVAAGLRIGYLASCLSFDAKIARIMTNLNAAVGEGMTAYTVNARVSDAEKAFLDHFCRSFGDALELDESLFPQFGVLAGCVPAFVYKFADELARAGVQMGLRKDMALRIASQTVLGSAKNLLQSDLHPVEWIDRVCTPAGTTIEGVAALDAGGFANAVHRAVLASYQRDQAIQREKDASVKK